MLLSVIFVLVNLASTSSMSGWTRGFAMISSGEQATAAGTPVTADPVPLRFGSGSRASPVWRAFRRSRAAIVGLVIIAIFLLTARYSRR